MIRTSKSTITVLTFERFNSSVLTIVTGELVRTGKLPITAFPCTFVGFFAGVGALVGFEVRALGIDFGTARISTTMDSLVPLRRFGIIIDGIHELIRIVWRGRGEGRR